MARGKGKGDSVSGWFRQYWRAHPELIRSKSNNAVVDAWKGAHTGKEFGRREKQALANTKSSVKKELRIGKPGRKPKGTVAAPVKAAKGPKANAAAGSLEQLELAIDRCLSTARSYEDRDDDMQKVVKHLRVARNELVWILGK